VTAALPASIRRSAERATLELPFRLPAKEWFTVREAAVVAGMSERYVEKKFEEGKQLSGHRHNGSGGKRHAIRIPRAWLVAWLVATAEYDDPTLCDAYCACLRRLPKATLARIAREASAQLVA
jgi:hypothetical protein